MYPKFQSCEETESNRRFEFMNVFNGGEDNYELSKL